MPIIQFNLMEGRSDSIKRELARRVCETVCDVLEVSPQTVRILIHELGANEFSVGGVTQGERLEEGLVREVTDEKN